MIPVADLKAALRIDTLEDAYAEEAQVALLEEIESAAVAWIERRTGRYFGPPVEDAEYVVPGSGSGTLLLPEYMSAVDSVDARPYLGADVVLIGEDDEDGWELRLFPQRSYGARLLRRGGHVWDWGLEYVIVGTAGYAAGEEPPEIRQAVRLLAGHWWEQRTPVGLVSREVEFTLRDILSPWIRHGV